jgi:aspartate/methionine/tyrosine aminotransferase
MQLAAAVTPKTKVISITHPHNPSGILSDEAELRRLARDRRRQWRLSGRG